MQYGAGASAVSASSPSGKPALLLLTSTGAGGRGGAAGAGAGGAGGPPLLLSPGDVVEATLLSAPGRPRARVSAAVPHGDSGAYVVALDLPANYTGEVSVVAVVGRGSGGSGGSSGSRDGGDGEKNQLTSSPLTFAVVRSPRVLVTASLPVE